LAESPRPPASHRWVDDNSPPSYETAEQPIDSLSRSTSGPQGHRPWWRNKVVIAGAAGVGVLSLIASLGEDSMSSGHEVATGSDLMESSVTSDSTPAESSSVPNSVTTSSAAVSMAPAESLGKRSTTEAAPATSTSTSTTAPAIQTVSTSSVPAATAAAPTAAVRTEPPPTVASTEPPASTCDPNYSGCVPIASDVDCEGGSGNGPAYVKGPINVVGTDIYGLDRDKDGIACE